MINNNWFFDRERTEKRFKELQNYYAQEKLNADNFNCKYHDKCIKSQSNNCIKQYSGGTAALLPFYDVMYKGQEIRVLIIGKETGYMKNEIYGTSPNFETNNLNLLNCINWKNKNNHIKGTLLTLQQIFEVKTEYIYASYALSDALRCSFQESDKINSVTATRDTKIMRDNCFEYLFNEIKILEPTLIICQGEWAIKGKYSFLDYLSNYLIESPKCLKNSINKKYGLYEFSKFMCITSHHPAIYGHWIKNLAPDSLWPMIEYLKEINYLPRFDSNATSAYESIVKPIIEPIISSLLSNDRLRSKNVLVEKEPNLFNI